MSFLDNIGSIFNDLSGATSAQKAEFAFNAEEAQKQRDWQTELSNSAYQRAVEDMKKAGLNPVNMFGGGNGVAASTPSGSSASGVGKSSNGLSILVNTALALATRHLSRTMRRLY